jgi:hypothetical protein
MSAVLGFGVSENGLKGVEIGVNVAEYGKSHGKYFGRFARA